MNKLYDILIVGASKEALELVTKFKNKTVLLISKNLVTNIPEFIEYSQNEVVFIQYNHGMFILSLKNTTQIACGKNLIIATGSDYKNELAEKYQYKNITTDVVDPLAKTVAVVGNNDKMAEISIKLAKSGATVYMLAKEGKMLFSNTNRLLVANLKKAVWLPRSEITTIEYLIDIDKLKITLDSYEELYCDYICDLSTRVPAIDWALNTKLVTATDEEYKKLIVNDDGTTERVPGLFAIGDCASQTVDYEKLIKKIL